MAICKHSWMRLVQFLHHHLAMAASAANTLLLISSLLHVCTALTDTITQGESMTSSVTMVSAGGVFELGFFSPGQSKNLYLGIWYKKISTQNGTVVWVANRHYPISRSFNSSCFLTINNESNLEISDGKGKSFPLTSVSPSTNTTATLFDSGNLILIDTKSNVTLWQSFDHPSDTFLPGMKLGFNSKTRQNWSLTSWSSSEDPAPGAFSLILDSSSLEFLIMNGSQRYWTSGRWNGLSLTLVPEIRFNALNFSFIPNDNGASYLTYSLNNKSMYSHFVMDLSGQLRLYEWLNDSNEWKFDWAQPRRQCDVYGFCGSFSNCNSAKIPNCECLKGFQPYSLRDHWSGHNRSRSNGCERNTSLQCGDKDRFIQMNVVRFPLRLEHQEIIGKNAEICKGACLNNCSCSAYAYSYSNGCSMWNGDLLGIEQAEDGGDGLFLKVAASELYITNGEPTRKKKLLLITLLPITLTMLIFGSLITWHLRRRKAKQRELGDKEICQDLLSFDFSTKTKSRKNELSNVNKTVNEGKWESWDVELPLFSLTSVSAATDSFNDTNKLGQGGFGPVFKGKLLNGQEVAIKRLSKGSGQGLEELKNEATLIAKLQHRNLVRLLGCCIEGEEKILVYEFLPNKSLDLFLFDPTNRCVLDWEKRIHISEGIAQGLLYLHEHSRLRIIHRDLKASNILLDSKMNAKISDFGMARLFGGNELQANTNRVVGTYGYMSPEYAMEGLFSIKSDVFSFGVLLLEILSSKRNSSFHVSDSITLAGHAWNLWKSGKGLELIDPMLVASSTSLAPKALRYINVALLCVQEQAIDRPTMANIVAMLTNEVIDMPSPKQPAFCFRSIVESNFSVIEANANSVNDVTISIMEAR